MQWPSLFAIHVVAPRKSDASVFMYLCICNARRHHVRVTVSRDTGPSASGLATTRQPPHRHLKCTWFSQCNAIILTWVQYNTATLQTFANIPPLDNHHHTTWSALGAPVYIAMLYAYMVHLVHRNSNTSARVQCFMLQQTQCIVINLSTTPQTFANVLKINIKYVVQNVRYVLFCTQDCVAVKCNAMKCDSLHCSQMWAST